jgi:fibronectin type 3 domain-containing protein
MRKSSLLIFSALLAIVAGCSKGNNFVSPPPTPQVPNAPTGLTAKAGDSSVALTWNTASGALSYNVYYGTASGVTKSSGKVVSAGAAPTYTLTGLTNGTTYYFVVTAANQGGESAISAEVNAKPVSPIPLAPSGLTATAGPGQVALAWTASSGATSYNVYYATATGVTTANGTKVAAGSGTTYTVTGLTGGTKYYFIVTAVNDSGESTASTEANATPIIPVPAAPTGLTAKAGPSQVSLAWTASAGATSYNVYYGTATGVTIANGKKVGGITTTTHTVSSLTSGKAYFFIVTAVNAAGESAASTEATATPTSGLGVSLTPGTPASGTLAFSAANSLTFQFPANAVSAPADSTRAYAAPIPQVQANDTFILAFQLTIDPTTITMFNVPVGINGTVDPTVSASGVTLNLAILSGSGSSQAWVDIATFVVGANGVLSENLPSTSLQGLLEPGTYLLYMPAKGSSTTVSNLGVVLIADDGYNMADGENGLQIIHLYDKNGNLLSTPTISFLDYPNQYDLDGQALTPDGSQGVMVDGSNKLAFFSGVQTGVPIASTTQMDVSKWGYDGDSIGIMPNGDEAVVSLDSDNTLLVVSGIVSGKPTPAEIITAPDYRDGVVISADGKVLLARGGSGLTVFSIANITPVTGSLGGTVAHSYTKVTDLPALGSHYDIEDGREGMAINPMDSSTAVVVLPSTGVVQLVTGLPAAPVAGPSVTLPSGSDPISVAISADGKFAVVGTYSNGLFLFSGLDQGKLTQVGTAGYQPDYMLGTSSVMLGEITTLGVTLDSKYVVAGDKENKALVVIPFSATGFAASPAAVLGDVAIPDNDQLLIH